MTCKNCLHFDVCRDYYNEMTTDCEKMAFLTTECNGHYKDKSQFVELPCKVEDIVYVIGENDISEQFITHITKDILKYSFHSKCIHYGICDYKNDDPCMADEEICEMGFTEYELGNTVFLTREEAEKALKEREKE